MKNFYARIGDVSITFDEIASEGYREYLPVRLERKRSDGGVDAAEGIAPSCVFKWSEGFSEDELKELEGLLQRNMLLLWEIAREVTAR